MIGPVILVASFIINPAPPANYTVDQLREFAIQHHNGIVFGGWLQGIDSLLIVLFAIGFVHLADATHSLAGWIALLTVSLVEVAFYLAACKPLKLATPQALFPAIISLKLFSMLF